MAPRPTQSSGDSVSPPGWLSFLSALDALRLDNQYTLDCLTEFIQSMEPVSHDSLTEERFAYLVESGTYTAEELIEAQAEVNRGGLQLNSIEAFLSHLLATLSLREAVSFLRTSEADVLAAVAGGSLHAATVAGRLRFPEWQFHLSSGNKLLPGIDRDFLSALLKRWPDWRSIAAFMSTPQQDLVAEGRKTPVAWLRDGEDPEEVLALVDDENQW